MPSSAYMCDHKKRSQSGRRGETAVKTFLLAIVAMIAISWGSAIVLERYQRTADYAYVGYGAKPDPEPSLHGGSVKH